MKKNQKILILIMLLGFSFSLSAQTTSYSLDDCIFYAWKNSTSLKRSQNQVRSEQSRLEQSRAALAPNLNLNVSQSYSSSNSYSSGSWDRESNASTNFSLSSSVTLYNGAKLRNTIRQNKLNLAVSELDEETEKDLISLDILIAYIDVLLAKEQYDNSVAQLQSTEKQLEYAEVRQTTGIISKADYLNIKSQHASEKASVVSAQNDLRMNYVSLMQLMNMAVSDDFQVITPEIESIIKDKIETNAETIYNLALGIRPDIKNAEMNIQSADLGVKIAKAEKLPSLSLSMGLGTGYNDNLSGVNLSDQLSNKISPSLGLSLSIPIFQRKSVKNQVTQATITADNYRLSLLEIKNDLRKSIEQACVDAKNADINYQALQEQYEAEQESYQMMEEMFGQGLINSVDFISSKNNLKSAENNLVRAKYNLVLQNRIINYYSGEEITF